VKDWTLITATNNEQVLKSSLLASPDVCSASQVILQKGYSSAAGAYNDAIEKAHTDILVFAHQDVYLPEGWGGQFQAALERLSKMDPRWAVAGVWGVPTNCEGVGHVFCTGLGRRLGEDFTQPVEVRTLDELMLVVRKSSGLRFDPDLPGYHMYGADICLQANQHGMKCYAISALCIHNTNGYGMLPMEFWKCYLQLRRKWKSVLPVTTPCATITFWCWPMIRWNLVRAINILFGRHQIGSRVTHPDQLWKQRLSELKTPAA
jgi:hypothetical protein